MNNDKKLAENKTEIPEINLLNLSWSFLAIGIARLSLEAALILGLGLFIFSGSDNGQSLKLTIICFFIFLLIFGFIILKTESLTLHLSRVLSHFPKCDKLRNNIGQKKNFLWISRAIFYTASAIMALSLIRR